MLLQLLIRKHPSKRLRGCFHLKSCNTCKSGAKLFNFSSHCTAFWPDDWSFWFWDFSWRWTFIYWYKSWVYYIGCSCFFTNCWHRYNFRENSKICSDAQASLCRLKNHFIRKHDQLFNFIIFKYLFFICFCFRNVFLVIMWNYYYSEKIHHFNFFYFFVVNLFRVDM